MTEFAPVAARLDSGVPAPLLRLMTESFLPMHAQPSCEVALPECGFTDPQWICKALAGKNIPTEEPGWN